METNLLALLVGVALIGGCLDTVFEYSNGSIGVVKNASGQPGNCVDLRFAWVLDRNHSVTIAGEVYFRPNITYLNGTVITNLPARCIRLMPFHDVIIYTNGTIEELIKNET